MVKKNLFNIIAAVFMISVVVALILSSKQNAKLKQSVEELDIQFNETNAIANRLSKQNDSLRTVISGPMPDEQGPIEGSNDLKTNVAKLKTMKDRPDSPEYIQTLSKIESLLNRTGYVQLIESSGALIFNKEVNTVYSARTARSVRRGVIGNPDYPNSSRNGDLILEGDFIVVLERISSGSAVWAKIKYKK